MLIQAARYPPYSGREPGGAQEAATDLDPATEPAPDPEPEPDSESEPAPEPAPDSDSSASAGVASGCDKSSGRVPGFGPWCSRRLPIY
jgi:hypothetical protein